MAVFLVPADPGAGLDPLNQAKGKMAKFHQIQRFRKIGRNTIGFFDLVPFLTIGSAKNALN
jgi:hypothetical protein